MSYLFAVRIFSATSKTRYRSYSPQTSTPIWGIYRKKEGFGFWCLSGDLDGFMKNMDKMTPDAISAMDLNGALYLADNYTVSQVADIIESSIK